MSRKITFCLARSAVSDESRTDTNRPFGCNRTACRTCSICRRADRYESLLAIDDWCSASDKQIETVEGYQRTQNENNTGAGDGHF
jgi:aerobic-type carbon monoxide dehydrogenase small subunit (CoxS/CutS family)